MNSKYKTIEQEGRSVFRDRGSRFIGIVSPVDNQEDIKGKLEQYRKEYHDARHCCYAYRLGYEGEDWRINDDGEPSGSAGKPIYGQLLSFEITNTLAVVIRYFGGTKLGIPGLINAYRTAARDAIMNTAVIEKEMTNDVDISFDYLAMNDVMRILKEENVVIVDSDYGMRCMIHGRVPAVSLQKIRNAFNLLNDMNNYNGESIKISQIND